ncbi:MAG: ATP synthase F1 subunit delta [Bdellovibrionota bacterium]
MSQNEISHRYAKALYAALKQGGAQDKGLAELRVVARIFSDDPAIKAYFSNPLVSANQKEEIVKKSFADKGLSADVLGLLLLMAKKNRIEYVSSVAKSYELISDSERGITTGTVRAAKPLQASDQKALEEKINQVLKKKIVLTFKEDPSLLGGVIAEVGGWTFDDSIDTHLKKLNEVLMK